MANSALGTKRLCAGCAAKFYDLGKDPIVCPTCETVHIVVVLPQSRGGRAHAARGAYNPDAQSANHAGALKEADAPGVSDDAEAKEDAEVAEIEDEETADETEAGGVAMLEELDEK